MNNNELTKEEIAKLAAAKAELESKSIAIHVSKVLGKPVDIALGALPEKPKNALMKVLNHSLAHAAGWAFKTTGSRNMPIFREDVAHHAAVAVSGAVGGFMGLGGMLWELPLSTLLMLRSIGCIAEHEGLDMSKPATRLGCVSVLALGANPVKVEADELDYWVTRRMLGSLVAQAASWDGKETAPVIVKFITEVASRFGLVVEGQMVVKAAPGIGAATGVLINYIFMQHYQRIAHAHFTIERLILLHGEKTVMEAYAKL